MDIPLKISEDLTEELCNAVRVQLTDTSENEITDLALAAYHDMNIRGISVLSEKDPLTRQALRLYCKANYGYDKDTERFQKAYDSLVDSMALSGDYKGSDAK